MIYKDFQGEKISALGMGGMRFPLCDGDNSKIDIDAVREMVDYAFKNGINYFDTAWGYHNGNSEIVFGKVLKDYPRDSFYIATKFPGYDRSNMEKAEEIFESQLKRCGVDYFDFYLFHNVNESNIDNYLDPQYKIYDFLMEQKKKGRIRHLGFSTHGSLDTMKRFLKAFGKDMEFCQIQLNWLDWKMQDAKSKVELLNEYRLPIWVMEPVRGGRLASIEPEYEAILKELRPEASVVEWAFRFLQSFPQVVVTLSGMSNMQQLKENIEIYKTDRALKKEETTVLFDVAKSMTANKTLPCTSCRYCTSYCPKELDIPALITLYNDYNYSGGGFLAPLVVGALAEDKKPSACLGCRACEEVCPQNIKISQMMTDFAKKLKK